MHRRDFFDGMRSEQSFLNLFPDAVTTDRLTDIKHVDFEIRARIDVKGLKGKNKQQKDESIHWIEIKNVQGRKGWLYGEADYFAFETNHYMILVSKTKLQEFVEKFDIENPQEKTKNPEFYVPYTRKGRKDVIVLVTSLDLCYLADGILKK